jgi:hypothetical protein
VKLFLLTSLLLAGCESIEMESEEAAPASAAVIDPTEAVLTGCSVVTSPRWSVWVPGMPSFVVNLSTHQHETGGFPVLVERITLTEVRFSYFVNPAVSADIAKFEVAIAQLNGGTCGMTGKLQGFPPSVERTVTMVPLRGTRYAPRIEFL